MFNANKRRLPGFLKKDRDERSSTWSEVEELQHDYGKELNEDVSNVAIWAAKLKVLPWGKFENLLRQYRTDAEYANQYRPNKT